ncbi:hypothetical protein HK096_005611, partial [Nowakowskiella sp. JEL0078]
RPFSILENLLVNENTPSSTFQARFRHFQEAKESKVQIKMEKLEQLKTRLFTSESRSHYLLYGHDAILTCDWCLEALDYKVYNTPKIFLQYSLPFAIFGICTTFSKPKTFWRLPSFCFLLVALIFDNFVLLTDSIFAIALHPRALLSMQTNEVISLFNHMFFLRHAYFAVLGCLILLINGKDGWTDVDIMNDLILKQQSMYSRSVIARIARAAALGDGTLRKKFMDFYKEQEAQEGTKYKDEEYKVLRENVLKRFSINHMISEAKAMSRAALEAAKQDGILEYDEE